MADLINIKQMYIYYLFCRASWSFKATVDCIRCSHFKVDYVSALEPSSKPPVRIIEDNVTALPHQQGTPYDPGYGLALDAMTT
jgi:hypothetical protein